MKDACTYLGGLIAFLNLLYFAVKIMQRKVPPTSSASWVMWTVLDGLLLGATISANQPPWLPLGYTIGASAVTLALFARGTWYWSYKETLCAVGAALTAYLWLSWSALAGIIAGIAAMTLAGIPVFIDLYRNPIRETWWMWAVTVLACIFTLIGSDWSAGGVLLAASGVVFNGVMTCMVLFKKPEPGKTFPATVVA